LPALLTLGFGAATLGAVVISATVGLLGVYSTSEGFYLLAAAVTEIVCVVAGGLLLLPTRDLSGRRSTAGRPRRPDVRRQTGRMTSYYPFPRRGAVSRR
jgi:hypothetical protein